MKQRIKQYYDTTNTTERIGSIVFFGWIIIAIFTKEISFIVVTIFTLFVWAFIVSRAIRSRTAVNKFSTCKHVSPLNEIGYQECAKSLQADVILHWHPDDRSWVQDDSIRYCTSCEFYDMTTDEAAQAILAYNDEYKKTHSDKWPLKSKIKKIKNNKL